MLLKNHDLTGVRTRRQILGLSGTDMAKRLGCTPTTYFRYERGERRAYIDQGKAIASFLGCTIDELDREPTDEEQIALFKRAKVRRDAVAQGRNPDEEEEFRDALAGWDGGIDEDPD